MRLSFRLLALIILGLIVVGLGCSNDRKKGTTVIDVGDVLTDTDGGPVGPIACQVNLDCLGQPGQDSCHRGRCDQAIGECVLWTEPNCCLSDEDCDDGLADTYDGCDPETHVCQFTNLEQPCQTELDCPGLEIPCTAVECLDYCVTWTQPDCCVTSEECDDGDDCTTEACNNFSCSNENKEDPLCCVETVALHSFSEETLDAYGLNGNNLPVAWHRTEVRTNSPGGALRFADPDGGTYSNPKGEDGIPASQGTFQLSPIALPVGTGELKLSFWLWLDMEVAPLFDLFSVRAVREGEDLGKVVWSKTEVAEEAYKTWTQVTIDITGLEGQSIAFVWDVDTLDGNINQGEGVYVDDIAVLAGCGEPTPCSSDSECVGDNPCLLGTCTNGVCVQTDVADCCVADTDCPAPPGSCGELVGCIDNQCEYDLQPPCCVTDADCSDDQFNVCGVCTTIGMCTYTEKVECCDDGECDDNDVCTNDYCRSNGTCQYDPIDGCVTTCATNDECDDQDGCTEDACVGGECIYGPVSCSDDDPCTIDVCADGGCQHTVDPDCVPSCILNSDCADGDPCTHDICQPNGVCTNNQLPNCAGDCSASSDCDDLDECTTNVCSNGSCTFVPIAGCGAECTTTGDCDDGNPCSIDVCSSGGACSHKADPGCTTCDDGPVYAKSFDVPWENLDWTLSTPVQGVGWTLGPVGNSTSGVGSLYYGNPETMTYDNGQQNFGSATSGTVVIAPTAPGAELSFMLYADIETLPGYDELELRVVTANNTTSVWDKTNLSATSFGQWHPVTVDLSMYAGQAIQLQWFFDTMDPIQNDTQGVYVDDVVVSQFCTIPTCGTNQDCNDGDECTTDLCASGTCQYIPIPDCGSECKTNLDCDNTSFCVINACLNGKCETILEVPDCCEADAECNDFNACTQNLCEGNQCLFLEIPGCGVKDCSVDADCTDGDPCTQDLCDGGVCLNKVIVGCCTANAQCDDSDSCTFDTCFDGSCAHVTLPGCAPPCQSDSDCVDENPCTNSVCFQNFCASQQIAGCCNLSSQCEDGNSCTTDVCVNNECAYNPTPGCCVADSQCDDNNACTNNACVNGSCTSTPNPNCCTSNSQCEDGDPCTMDSCQDGQCVSKVAPDCCVSSLDCNDGNACTTDVCFNGQCLNPPTAGCCTSNGQCSDGNPCTQDICAENQCSNSSIPNCCTGSDQCSDGNVCTTDVCSNNQCLNQPISGCCTSSGDCDDDDPCTVDVCDGSTGQCSNPPGGGANCCTNDGQCDDGNPCTDNTCGNSGVCVAAANTAACDDGLFCNGSDSCGGGECVVHSGDPCQDVGDEDFDCTESCNEIKNDCSQIDPEGSLCSDGVACTVGDACNFAGTCIPGVDPCDGPDGDGNCSESCETLTGLCVGPDPDGSSCADDGNPCTSQACVGGACASSPIPNCCATGSDCNDGNPCTLDTCNSNNGCVFVTIPGCGGCTSSADCDDGNPCTVDLCDASTGECANEPGGGPNCCTNDGQCDDGNPCTDNLCSSLGACTAMPNTAGCDDGLFCTGSDSCGGGACSVHTGDPCQDVGDDDFDCTESCDESKNNCSQIDPEGSPCSDGLACTVGDACNFAGTCIPGVDPCDGPDGDGNCSESCETLTGLCGGSDPDGSSCADDGNPCTSEACAAGVCVTSIVPNCCASALECDDSDPCTDDTCQNNQCTHIVTPECCEPQSVVDADFDSGIGGWTSTGTTDSKWQLSGNNTVSEPSAFWFGNANTGDFSCQQNACVGVLSSPPISVPNNESLLLTFSVYVDVEQDPNWDSLELRIMLDETGGVVLWDKSVLQSQDYGTWKTYKVDLSPWHGKTFFLRWFFDTGDSINNGGDGVFLDNVSVDTSCQSLSDLCVFNTDCVDSDPCTESVCVNSTCQFVENPNCCTSSTECDDEYVCTNDQCVDGACQYVAIPGCCQFAGECDDGNECTADSCSNGSCTNSPIGGAGCCNSNADCDDGDACTEDTCTAFQCQYQSGTGPGCCLAGELLSENFDDATAGDFTLIQDDSGALWSVQNQRFFSGPFSLYYGVPGQWTTNTGSTNSGQAISAPIQVPLGSESVSLTFAVWADVIGGGPFGGNTSFVIQVLDGNTLKTVWTLDNTPEEQWSLESVELNEYKGKTIQLYFETSMPPIGNPEGIYLDSIKLTNTCKGPPVIINP